MTFILLNKAGGPSEKKLFLTALRNLAFWSQQRAYPEGYFLNLGSYGKPLS